MALARGAGGVDAGVVDWRHSNRPWFITFLVVALAMFVTITAMGAPLVGLLHAAGVLLVPVMLWGAGAVDVWTWWGDPSERRSSRSPKKGPPSHA
jgi:hypothetical protein